MNELSAFQFKASKKTLPLWLDKAIYSSGIYATIELDGRIHLNELLQKSIILKSNNYLQTKNYKSYGNRTY